MFLSFPLAIQYIFVGNVNHVYRRTSQNTYVEIDFWYLLAIHRDRYDTPKPADVRESWVTIWSEGEVSISSRGYEVDQLQLKVILLGSCSILDLIAQVLQAAT